MSERHYSYDPCQITSNTISRARFELGDMLTDGGEDTCFLCDEEIQAVIDACAPRWKYTLYTLANAVCMRLSYETDWRDDGTSFSLNQRAERWWKLRDKLKKEAEAEATIPVSGAVRDSINSADGGHYFYRGMNNNPQVQPPYIHPAKRQLPPKGGRRR